MNQRTPACLSIAMISLAISAMASEVLTVEVEIDDDIYRMHGESLIEAPVDFIFDILSDFDNFHRISNGVTETRFLNPGDDGVLVAYTRIESCVWFYCRKFEKVENLWTNPPTEILAIAIPEDSDFKFSESRWTLKEGENGTLVIFDAEMDPDFWVPPVIGPWAFKRALRESAESIGWRIEYLFQSGKSLSEFGGQEPADDSVASEPE